MMTIEATALDRNMVADLRDLTVDMPKEGEFTDSDIERIQGFGIDIDSVLRGGLADEALVGQNSFLCDIKRKMSRYGKLTIRQQRAALNALRDGWNGYKRPYAERNIARTYECPEDGEIFDTHLEMLEHRRNVHGWEPVRGSYEQALIAPEAVTDVEEETQFDFSGLANGYYAVPVPTEKDGFIYIRVRRLTKAEHFNKKFRYGKFVSGSEILPKGTLMIRRWQGESKELIGVQRPDGMYRGSRTTELSQVLAAPLAFAQMFAVKFKRCFRCGRALTDPTSQALLMGSDCQTKYGLNYHDEAVRAARERDAARVQRAIERNVDHYTS